MERNMWGNKGKENETETVYYWCLSGVIINFPHYQTQTKAQTVTWPFHVCSAKCLPSANIL